MSSSFSLDGNERLGLDGAHGVEAEPVPSNQLDDPAEDADHPVRLLLQKAPAPRLSGSLYLVKKERKREL